MVKVRARAGLGLGQGLVIFILRLSRNVFKPASCMCVSCCFLSLF
jgi:hypothetical protein